MGGWDIFPTEPPESASFGLEGLLYSIIGQGGGVYGVLGEAVCACWICGGRLTYLTPPM